MRRGSGYGNTHYRDRFGGIYYSHGGGDVGSHSFRALSHNYCSLVSQFLRQVADVDVCATKDAVLAAGYVSDFWVVSIEPPTLARQSSMY